MTAAMSAHSALDLYPDGYPAVADVVPHQDAMCLLDRIVYCDAERIEVEVRVPSVGLFVTPGGIPAWIGIEYMAQAIAAWAGCRERRDQRPPGIGFLLGSRRYSSARDTFPTGTLLHVHARCELLGDNGLGMFACRILAGDEEWAAANVSVFQPNDATAYLESGTT